MESLNLEKLRSLWEFKLVFSLFLGFIIGLEREIRAKFGKDIFAGIRTFPLISVLGTITGLLCVWLGSLVPFALTFLSISLLISVSYFKDRSYGITTEVAVLITFFIGFLVSHEHYHMATFITITTAFLLVLKKKLEGLAQKLDEEDILAVLKFVALLGVIYPLLPNKEIFPGFNPAEVWLFVIIVSAIDFLGYFLLKYKGDQSILLMGIVGGFVSSTAVTLAFSELSRKFKGFTHSLFFSVMLAWGLMFARVIFFSALLYPKVLPTVLLLFLPYLLILLGYGYAVYRKERLGAEIKEKLKLVEPFTLSQAILFGFVYAGISVASYYLKSFLGSRGLIVVSLFSGIIDVDAISLYLLNALKKDELELWTTVLGLLLAVSSNNVFKSLYGIAFGNREFRKYFTITLIITLLYTLLSLPFLSFLRGHT